MTAETMTIKLSSTRAQAIFEYLTHNVLYCAVLCCDTTTTTPKNHYCHDVTQKKEKKKQEQKTRTKTKRTNKKIDEKPSSLAPQDGRMSLSKIYAICE